MENVKIYYYQISGIVAEFILEIKMYKINN